LATPGSTVGCDFSGTVIEAGPDCVKGFKAGDRIAGVTHGANASDLNSGCFAEYAVVREGAAYKVPDSLSFEEAATTGVGLITVSLALYQKLGLPFPGEGKSDEWILIYGGSTATGSLAIQYAKL
jgi:NADPH:quinone reductase-like Zn-dependent oxidoreductase